MATITVTPEKYDFVEFDSAEVAAIASTLADKIGLPADLEVRIELDEKSPLTRTRTDSLDPVTLSIEGGAIEDPTAPRKLSDRLSADVIGRMLLRVKDRMSGGFADAPGDAELDLAQQTAWDTYCMGRLERLGYDVRQPRRIYHFRNRHGFTDVSDRVFQRLWQADSLTWADIEAACAETASVKQPA